VPLVKWHLPPILDGELLFVQKNNKHFCEFVEFRFEVKNPVNVIAEQSKNK